MRQQAIRGYADEADAFISRYEALSSAEIYAHLLHFLPSPPCSLVDIGAGTGRDAAWFSARGYSVLAVEPVGEFREAGISRHRDPKIEWIDDTLPALAHVLRRSEAFDLVLASGVWQHIDDGERRVGMGNISRLTAPRGRLVLSLRHGPGAPARPCYPSSVRDTVGLAETHGLHLVFSEEQEAVQPQNRSAGVTWNWLVFSRET